MKMKNEDLQILNTIGDKFQKICISLQSATENTCGYSLQLSHCYHSSLFVDSRYLILSCIPFKIIYPMLPQFLKSSWDHPAGPKTIFFWAPTIKWCLVLAGFADMMRPAEKLSFYQVNLKRKNCIAVHEMNTNLGIG